MVAFLGGTIGNLLPDERADFLSRLRTVLAPGEWLLVTGASSGVGVAPRFAGLQSEVK